MSLDGGGDHRYIAVEYEAASGTYYTYHDPEGSVAEDIVRAVATVSDAEPTGMEPLTETVDPDALDRIVESFPPDHRWRLTFVFDGYEVSVDGDGRIELCPVE